MTTQDVIEAVAVAVNEAIAREDRHDIRYNDVHEWHQGTTRISLIAGASEIMYQVNGSTPTPITPPVTTYDAATVKAVVRSVLNMLRVDLPTDDEVNAEARERARRCPHCAFDTQIMTPRQMQKVGSSVVQWDIICPNCRQKFWVDVRSTATASRSPFYQPPSHKRRR